MKRRTLLAAISFCMIQVPAFAQTQGDDVEYAATPQQNEAVETGAPQTRFISGGVADDGMQRIQTIQDGYNLKLWFVATDGAYLADVDVKIANHKGDVLVDTVTSGPVLLAELPVGSYKITATSEGVTKTQTLRVGKQRLSSYYFRYASHES